MSETTSADALIEQFSSTLDPSLVLAIVNEPGQSIDEATNILKALAGTVPAERENEARSPPMDATSMEFTLFFLQETFPNVSSEHLETLLATSEGDLDTAMDKLYVEQMLSNTSASVKPLSGGLDFDALAQGLSVKKTKSKKSKLKNRTTGPITVSLTDQRSPHHIYYDMRTARSGQMNKPSQAIASVDTTGLTDEEIARKLQNAERDAAEAASIPVADQQWLLASSSLSQLATLLRMPQSRIQSVFNQSSFNLHVTFGRAVEAAMMENDAQQAAQAEDFGAMCASIADITGETEREIRRLLQASRGNQDAVFDLLQLRGVIKEAAGGSEHGPDILDPAGRVGIKVPNAERVMSTQSEHKTPGGPAPRWLSSDKSTYAGRVSNAAFAPYNARSTAVRTEGMAVTLPASASRVDAPKNVAIDDMASSSYTTEECRERANECRARRNAALQQAARSVRQSRTSKIGGASMVYAEEARKHDMEARRWQMLASCALVDQRRLDSSATHGGATHGGERIDLHGLTVHEALTVVAQNVARWQSTPLGEARHRAPLEIVTGRGVHSRHNMSVLRPAIVRYLSQRGWRVDDTSDPGVLYVKSSSAPVI